MENNEKLKQNAQELKKGLELLSRDRKVVLPHNKAFDLVDELQEKVDEIINITGSALIRSLLWIIAVLM